MDLLAPMPDVDVTKPRILVLEGKLRFRDQHANKVSEVKVVSCEMIPEIQVTNRKAVNLFTKSQIMRNEAYI